MWFKVKKHIIFHMPYIIVAPHCPAFLKFVDFYKAHHSEKRGLIGQLSSALWLAEYLKLEMEMLRPLPYVETHRFSTVSIKVFYNKHNKQINK